MQRTHQADKRIMAGLSYAITVETTLYDLVEAVNEEVQPEEDHLVHFIVKGMLNTGGS